MKNLIATLAIITAFSANAQDYPNKPITVVMPYAAGGPGDTTARIIASGMTTHLKQQVIIENVAGAGGTVGAGRVAAASPDGYYLLMNHVGQATNPALYPNLKFHMQNDFEMVGVVGDVPMAFVTKKDFPANNFAEMITHIKANKDKVTYAHAGIGSASHLCGLMFASAINTKFTEVAYRGTGPAMNDLVGGQVDFSCDQSANLVSHVAAKNIKAHAVTTPEKIASLPDVPTTISGGYPTLQISIWYGLYAPKGTPKPVVDKLVEALRVALKDKAVLEKFEPLGIVAANEAKASPAGLAAHLKSETEKWGAVIKAAGVTGQ